MQIRAGARWGLLFGLVGVWAVAQEPDVELTRSVPAEYRPTLAVLEVVAADQASSDRARQLERELLSMLASSGQFEPVTSPAQVREQDPDLRVECTTLACLETARTRLEVQRVARIIVEKYEAGSRVTLLGLDPSVSGLVRAELNIDDQTERFENLILHTQAQADLRFLARVIPQLRAGFRALATPNAKLVVENADPGLTVLLDGNPEGTGRLELLRPPGQLRVSIGGTFYEPFDRMVTLKGGETTTVELRLHAKAVDPIVVKRPGYSGLMSRPGVYLAMGGLTFLGVGLGLGISALVIEERLARGSPVPVTRLEAMNGPAQATLANVFVIGGAAMSAGGIAWVALTPPAPTPKVDEPAVPGVAQSWTFSIGGRL